MFYYREAGATETNPQEQRLANLTTEVCSSRLGIRPAELRFMIETSYAGEIAKPERITGYQRGRQIFVLTGLQPVELVKCIGHEVRHVYQRDSGKQCYDRERDARLFESELTLNLRGQTFDHLQAELICLKYSARSDARPAYPKPKPLAPVVRDVSQAPVAEIRVNKLFETVPERIQYIRSLLARLPNTAEYQQQRANLAAELAERLAK